MTISYVFGDLKTGAIIEEIPLFSVSMFDELNADGELRGSFQLDMTGKINSELVAATIPGRCYVVAELNNSPIWGGIVWSRTYQGTSKTCQLYCRSFEVYPFRRLMREDMLLEDDQTALFFFLWNDMQSKPNGNLLVESPSNIYSQPTGIIKTCDCKASEYRTYGQVMSQFADGFDGFDWKINIVRDGGVYRRILKVGYPMLGAPASDDSIVLEFPGAITNYWETDSISATGTNVDVIGAGEGNEMLVSRWNWDDLLNSGWLVFDFDIAHKDVTNQNTLNGIARQEAINHRPPGVVLKTEILTDVDPVYGSYSLGDFMNVVLNDPKHDKEQFQKRLIRREFWPAESSNVGHAILTFEGAGEEA